jgi:hypothetical protein
MFDLNHLAFCLPSDRLLNTMTSRVSIEGSLSNNPANYMDWFDTRQILVGSVKRLPVNRVQLSAHSWILLKKESFQGLDNKSNGAVWSEPEMVALYKRINIRS